MKQNKFWLKLIGVALLLHMALIFLSIIVVAIYSYVINPGHDKEFYTAFATRSGPWVSIIFGSLFLFLLVKRYISRFSQRHLTYAIALPLAYTLIDLLIVLAANTDLKTAASLLIAGNGAKFIASIIAYFIYSRKNASNKVVSR